MQSARNESKQGKYHQFEEEIHGSSRILPYDSKKAQTPVKHDQKRKKLAESKSESKSIQNSPAGKVNQKFGYHKKSFTVRFKRPYTLIAFEDFLDSKLSQGKFQVPGLDEDESPTAKQQQLDVLSSDSMRVKRFSLTEEDDYRVQSGGRHKKVSNFVTALNIYTSFFGACVLVIPSVFAKVGMIGGIVGMVFIGLMNLYILQLQIETKEKSGKSIYSYIELARASLTPSQVLFTEFCVLSGQIGFGIAKLIFMASQVEKVICANMSLCNLKNQYIVLIAFIAAPICWFNQPKFFAYFGLMSNIILLSCIFIILRSIPGCFS